MNLPSYKFRNLQRWRSPSLSLLTDQKSLHCHFHSECSYLTEQGLYVRPRSSLGACIFSPVPQWLLPLTLAKQSASRYAFSSTIWTQRGGVEWLWACDIYTNPRLVLPCFPFWARMQMEFGAAQAAHPRCPGQFPVRYSLALCSGHGAQLPCSLNVAQSRSRSQWVGQGGSLQEKEYKIIN